MEHNPHLTPLSEKDPEVTQIDCWYPLISRCNGTPYHCLHGFIEFLNDRLGLAIKPTAFKGDIHLSPEEQAWFSQVHELTGEDTPFWIVAAGGKYDLTIKWWQTERYQEVIDHFRGKIAFVQVGQYGHHHPRLDGVIDLRGQTSLRELVRLVYHAQGVLCSVTALMHLAAAVETRRGRPVPRPCVVVAGGREPAHWEAYPGHQFIHTNGALACCAQGGCWKDRIAPLRDGDKRDRPGRLCVDVVNGPAALPGHDHGGRGRSQGGPVLQGRRFEVSFALAVQGRRTRHNGDHQEPVRPATLDSAKCRDGFGEIHFNDSGVPGRPPGSRDRHLRGRRSVFRLCLGMHQHAKKAGVCRADPVVALGQGRVG